MVLIFECGRAKVDEANLWIKQHSALRRRPVGVFARRRNFTIICKGLVVTVHEKDVLGLEIRMDELQIVQD